MWAGAHGDINLITALPRATAPGLQVLVGDEWVDAVAPDGQVIINTGMMLERLTNGVIPTGVHRVVAAPGFSGERYSVVQFCHPTPWTLLNPLASCIRPEHPQRFSGMVAPTRSTSCSTRSTSSRTPAGSAERRWTHRRRAPTVPRPRVAWRSSSTSAARRWPSV